MAHRIPQIFFLFFLMLANGMLFGLALPRFPEFRKEIILNSVARNVFEIKDYSFSKPNRWLELPGFLSEKFLNYSSNKSRTLASADQKISDQSDLDKVSTQKSSQYKNVKYNNLKTKRQIARNTNTKKVRITYARVEKWRKAHLKKLKNITKSAPVSLPVTITTAPVAMKKNHTQKTIHPKSIQPIQVEPPYNAPVSNKKKLKKSYTVSKKAKLINKSANNVVPSNENYKVLSSAESNERSKEYLEVESLELNNFKDSLEWLNSATKLKKNSKLKSNALDIKSSPRRDESITKRTLDKTPVALEITAKLEGDTVLSRVLNTRTNVSKDNLRNTTQNELAYDLKAGPDEPGPDFMSLYNESADPWEDENYVDPLEVAEKSISDFRDSNGSLFGELEQRLNDYTESDQNNLKQSEQVEADISERDDPMVVTKLSDEYKNALQPSSVLVSSVKPVVKAVSETVKPSKDSTSMLSSATTSESSNDAKESSSEKTVQALVNEVSISIKASKGVMEEWNSGSGSFEITLFSEGRVPLKILRLSHSESKSTPGFKIKSDEINSSLSIEGKFCVDGNCGLTQKKEFPGNPITKKDSQIYISKSEYAGGVLDWAWTHEKEVHEFFKLTNIKRDDYIGWAKVEDELSSLDAKWSAENRAYSFGLLPGDSDFRFTVNFENSSSIDTYFSSVKRLGYIPLISNAEKSAIYSAAGISPLDSSSFIYGIAEPGTEISYSAKGKILALDLAGKPIKDTQTVGISGLFVILNADPGLQMVYPTIKSSNMTMDHPPVTVQVQKGGDLFVYLPKGKQSDVYGSVSVGGKKLGEYLLSPLGYPSEYSVKRTNGEEFKVSNIFRDETKPTILQVSQQLTYTHFFESDSTSNDLDLFTVDEIKRYASDVGEEISKSHGRIFGEFGKNTGISVEVIPYDSALRIPEVFFLSDKEVLDRKILEPDFKTGKFFILNAEKGEYALVFRDREGKLLGLDRVNVLVNSVSIFKR